MKKIFATILLISLIGTLNLMAQVRIYTPELNTPLNGTIDHMPDVLLNWKAVTGGTTGIIHYEAWLDNNPEFSNPVSFETEFLTAVKTSELIFSQLYYWKVRAKDGSDVSDWSETWSFRVIQRPVLRSPNDATSQTTDVKLEWNEITGTTEYEYQIDTAYYWKPITSGVTSHLFSTAVVDENNGWIVGAGGAILYYDGVSISPQTSNTTQNLNGVFFLEAEHGWAVGNGGVILFFDGTEWTAQASGTTQDLFGVHFLDASHGWAFGKSGTMLVYNGTNWTSQSTGATKDILALFALSENNVHAVGKIGLVLHYNGTSWTETTGVSNRDLQGVAFGSEDDGWAVGKNGTLIQFRNGTWTPLIHSLTIRDLMGIIFTAPDNAWIVGKNGTMLQYNGISWYNQTPGVTSALNAISLSSTVTAGFIAGDNGLALIFNDDAFTSPMAVIKSVPATKLSADLYDLLFGTRYFWRVRAKHAESVSEWSGARSFNTSATVELDKPINNAVNQNLDVLLKWKRVSPLVNYEIEVDDDPDFGSPIFFATSNIEINARLLKFGVQYYWRARALHPFDTSAWSNVWTFTTVNSVNLKTPANNATNVGLSPMLSWDALTGITGYQVYVSQDNTFENLLVSGVTLPADNFFAIPIVLNRDTDYYWKVRAVNGLDTSGWSPVWTFRTMPPVGITEPGLDSKLSIYPNPADHVVYVQLKDKQSLFARLSVTDLVGKTVIEKEILLDSSNKIITIDVAGLRNGIYLLRLADQQSVLTKKLIIRR
ncbi:MAG: T9SS type A sorting domain-containing protein [Bacteroidales bacterium]|nr:T9SS type A sorting domain-containing protein [Bacteroidales bacterium]